MLRLDIVWLFILKVINVIWLLFRMIRSFLVDKMLMVYFLSWRFRLDWLDRLKEVYCFVRGLIVILFGLFDWLMWISLFVFMSKVLLMGVGKGWMWKRFCGRLGIDRMVVEVCCCRFRVKIMYVKWFFWLRELEVLIVEVRMLKVGFWYLCRKVRCIGWRRFGLRLESWRINDGE